MKILLIALSDSIHTARWVRQLSDIGWDVRLFPSIDYGVVHPGLSCIPVYHMLGAQSGPLGRKLRWQHHRLFTALRSFLGVRLLPQLWPQRRMQQLLRIIDEFQPDIIHSLEFQAAGYLTAAAKREKGALFPPWIATNWGSDIYHFRQFPEHEKLIRKVLELCDYYSCECRRDVCLAKGLGLKGKVLPVFPNTGGFDLDELRKIRQPGPISLRRIIVLKGYQHWVGRALIGLAALGQCADLLEDYELVIHSVSVQTKKAALTFQKRTGIRVTLLPHNSSHEAILKMYGNARIAIGLSLSDGISTSLLEALVMGAFPIQSWTACADEWIEDGKTGLLVPPEDPDVIEKAIRHALTDDAMVDQAAEENWRTAQERLDHNLLKHKAVELYNTVAAHSGHL